jgi:hypothetical protein
MAEGKALGAKVALLLIRQARGLAAPLGFSFSSPRLKGPRDWNYRPP